MYALAIDRKTTNHWSLTVLFRCFDQNGDNDFRGWQLWILEGADDSRLPRCFLSNERCKKLFICCLGSLTHETWLFSSETVMSGLMPCQRWRMHGGPAKKHRTNKSGHSTAEADLMVIPEAQRGDLEAVHGWLPILGEGATELKEPRHWSDVLDLAFWIFLNHALVPPDNGCSLQLRLHIQLHHSTVFLSLPAFDFWCHAMEPYTEELETVFHDECQKSFTPAFILPRHSPPHFLNPSSFIMKCIPRSSV